jgi:hypothetical protein
LVLNYTMMTNGPLNTEGCLAGRGYENKSGF